MTVTKIYIGDLLEDPGIDPEDIKRCKISKDGDLWLEHGVASE